MFDPKPTKYPFPKDTGSHYLVVKKNDGTVFDEHYPYVDRSKGMLFKQFWTRVLLHVLVFPVAFFKLGLRIKGRENLRKHKEELSGGAISIANHIHLWDYISIMKAVRPRKTNVLVWAPNIRGENGAMMRLVGGIPIPEGNYKATLECFRQVEKLLNEGGWLHLYPEGSMWEYYAPIRPFKHGAAYFACKFNKPVVPFGFSYRKPSWIRKRLFGQQATLTLHVGEPIWPNPELEGGEAEVDLTKRLHEAVCRLVGFGPGENPYEPIYSAKTGQRINYYAQEYGHE